MVTIVLQTVFAFISKRLSAVVYKISLRKGRDMEVNIENFLEVREDLEGTSGLSWLELLQKVELFED